MHGQTGASLLQAADQALYAAKRLGRNRSVISSAEVPGILGRGRRAGATRATWSWPPCSSLAEALDVRDTGSATHCQRVGRYAELIARELGLPPDSVERVRIAGILHDVGRVGVPDELLAKDGPLNEEEWHWVRSHPEIGARMLETTDFADIGEWIRAHHERPDGTRLPGGPPAGEVPLEAAHPGRGRRLRGHDRPPALPRGPGPPGGRPRSCAGAQGGSSTSAWSTPCCGSSDAGRAPPCGERPVAPAHLI